MSIEEPPVEGQRRYGGVHERVPPQEEDRREIWFKPVPLERCSGSQAILRCARISRSSCCRTSAVTSQDCGSASSSRWPRRISWGVLKEILARKRVVPWESQHRA